MNDIVFPREIIENILIHADGNTLIQAKSVSNEWKAIVCYLENKYQIWKKACLSDIPAEDLCSLIEKYGWKSSKDKWKILFHNWYLWQFIGKKDFISNPSELKDVTCCKLSGFCIAKGVKNGYVSLIDQRDSKLIETIGPLYSKIHNVHFMNEKYEEDGHYDHTDIIIKVQKYLLFMKLNPLRIILDIDCLNHYALYKNYIVVVKPNNIINVHKINFMEDDSLIEFITGCRIYSPSNIRAVSIFDGSVMILTDANILEMRYDVDLPETVALIVEHIKFPVYEAKKIQIYYNHYIFVIIQNYIYISHIPPCPCKISEYVSFDCFKEIGSYPSAVFLHGKIFAIGTRNGSLFMYYVKDWNKFHVKNYDKKINVCKEEITSIDLSELENELLWTVITETGLTLITEDYLLVLD